MKDAASSILQSIDLPQLTGIVRQASGRDSIHIRDWQVNQLGGGVGNPVSVGLYRFQGGWQDGDDRASWSVVLKIIQSPANVGEVDMGEGDDQSHWNYWKRELYVYQSGLLDTLPEGLAAPRCYGAAELPGNVAMLWLEDIGDAYAGEWSLDRYALAARHLGRLNGSYVSGQSLPAFPWLSIDRNRQWVAFPWQEISWDHPKVLELYPRPEVNAFRRLLFDHERFLAKLALVPKTLCHGDTYPTNLKARFLPDGSEQTVALDWALTGIQPLGDDLGQLVFGAQMNLDTAGGADAETTLFDSYIDGLRDSGCRVDPQVVRFGFSVSAAMRVGMFRVLMLSANLKQNDAAPQEEIRHASVPDCFEVTMAKEAFELLESI